MKTIEIYCDGAALNNGCKNSIASYGIVILLIENGNIIGWKQYSGLCEPVNSTNNYAFDDSVTDNAINSIDSITSNNNSQTDSVNNIAPEENATDANKNSADVNNNSTILSLIKSIIDLSKPKILFIMRFIILVKSCPLKVSILVMPINSKFI